MIAYGFCTFFVVAWPPVLALCLLNNCVEFHVDRFKLTSVCRPPFPVTVEDLGAWNDVLACMSKIATLTNIFMFVYLADGLPKDFDPTLKFMVFVLIEYIMVQIGFMVEHVAPDVPVKVAIQRKRTKFVIDELLGGSRALEGDGDDRAPRGDGRGATGDVRARRLIAEAKHASELRLLHNYNDVHSIRHERDRRPPLYRHENHRDLVATRARSSSSSSLVEVQCRRVGDVGGLNDDASDRSLSFGSN